MLYLFIISYWKSLGVLVSLIYLSEFYIDAVSHVIRKSVPKSCQNMEHFFLRFSLKIGRHMRFCSSFQIQ